MAPPPHRGPLTPSPGGRRHGTCEPCHGAAATVALAAAASLHLSSPPTPQEAGETPPSSSSGADRGPLLVSGCLWQTPDHKAQLGVILSRCPPTCASYGPLESVLWCVSNSAGSQVFKPEEFFIRRVPDSPASRPHGPLMHMQQIVTLARRAPRGRTLASGGELGVLVPCADHPCPPGRTSWLRVRPLPGPFTKGPKFRSGEIGLELRT